MYLVGGENCSPLRGKQHSNKDKRQEISIDPQQTVRSLHAGLVECIQANPASDIINGDSDYNLGREMTHYTTITYQGENLKTESRLHCESTSLSLTIPATNLLLSIYRTVDDTLHAKIKSTSHESESDAVLTNRLLQRFCNVFSSICDNPNQLVADVNSITTQDYEWMTNFTSSVSPPQNELLHDLCFRHLLSTPDAPAVRSWDGDLTYKELEDLTTRLSHWLVSQGVRPGIIVACTFYKSTWAIVARLAVLMAGGAYLCVDAHDPPVYLDSVLERTRVNIILTSSGFADRFSDRGCVFEVSAASLQALPYQSGIPCPILTPSDPCIILFTSGSTGTPKGIIQEHRSYASALTDYIRVMKMGPQTRMFHFDAYAFDISNNDFLAPLMAGGCCCVPASTSSMDAVMTQFVDLEANMMFVTPSVAIDIDPDRVPALQTLCLGGEPISDAVLVKWLGRTRVVNQYGMGEVASLCAFNPDLQVGKGSVIGRPATGALWVVDPDNPDRLMPIGAVGEILVEGPHVARGYLDPVSGQSANFLDVAPSWMARLHPRRAQYHMYCSGDLGRYNHDGSVELIGRKDSMLKLDGARIEPGQVEPVMKARLSDGDMAVVDVLGVVDGVSDPILVAFLFLSGNPMNSVAGPVDKIDFRPVMPCDAIHSLTMSLKDAVKESLPIHYLPSLFLLMDRVPRTKSRKIDRRKLHLLGQEYYMARREELREVTVWPIWD